VLEGIRREASLIRAESAALRILLETSGRESAGLRNRLREVEIALSEAEAALSEAGSLLGEASLSLGKSEAALIPLREELGKLKSELGVLREQAVESNRRLTRSTRGERFWMAAALSVAAVFAAVEIGRVLIK
jgi:chromosome segregation ATPase